MSDDTRPGAEHRTLRSLGLTLLGVVASISTTVAFGLPLPWWGRLLAGLATAASLVVVIKVTTSEGSKGPVARLADWITGSDSAG